jgi:hypothetical protein
MVCTFFRRTETEQSKYLYPLAYKIHQKGESGQPRYAGCLQVEGIIAGHGGRRVKQHGAVSASSKMTLGSGTA